MGDTGWTGWKEVWICAGASTFPGSTSWITGAPSGDAVGFDWLILPGAGGVKAGGVNFGVTGVSVEGLISKAGLVESFSGNSGVSLGKSVFVALVESGDRGALVKGDGSAAPGPSKPLGHFADGVAKAPTVGSMEPPGETMLMGGCLGLGDSDPAGDDVDTVPALLGGDGGPSAAVESAWAIPDPLASAAPMPKVSAPAPSQVEASGTLGFALRDPAERLT